MHRRPFHHAILLAAVLPVILAVPTGFAAGPLLIDDFRKGFSAGWEKKVFKGETVCTPAREGLTHIG